MENTENVEHIKTPDEIWDEKEAALRAAGLYVEPETVAVSDTRVCLCGHSARAHSSESVSATRDTTRFTCTFGRMVCPCTSFQHVLTATPVRGFSFKTTGPGEAHALKKGIRKAKSMGSRIDWVGVPACAVCGAVGVDLIPTAVTRAGVVLDRPSAHNILLCADDLSAFRLNV